MPNYKLIITYDGTRYSGWQHQVNDQKVKTVQGQLNKILTQIFQQDIETFGASRTDAGVHALGQTANFHSTAEWEPHRLKRSLNALLDDDIRIRDVSLVDEDFHSRFSTGGKRYRYKMAPLDGLIPFERLYTYHYKGVLNVALMQEAASCYVGEYDFVAFSCNSAQPVKTTVRTMTHASVVQKGETIEFVIEGTAFLYKMVRCMTGVLMAVGLGRMTVDEVKTMLSSAQRNPRFNVAEAHGLCLEEVFYDDRLKQRP